MFESPFPSIDRSRARLREEGGVDRQFDDPPKTTLEGPFPSSRSSLREGSDSATPVS
jgi:hypothetical protein